MPRLCPWPRAPYEVAQGSVDVPRRLLEAADIERVFEAEIDERQRAVAEYRGHGLDTADLELELTTLKRYGQGRCSLRSEDCYSASASLMAASSF
jgi:hypothetical protein